MRFRKIRYNHKKCRALPHVVLASDVTRDPNILENIITDNEKWFDAVSDYVEDISPLFDIYGDCIQRHEVHNVSLNRYDLGDGNILVNDIHYIINSSESSHYELAQPSNIPINIISDYTSHIPHFTCQSIVIKQKFDGMI